MRQSFEAAKAYPRYMVMITKVDKNKCWIDINLTLLQTNSPEFLIKIAKPFADRPFIGHYWFACVTWNWSKGPDPLKIDPLKLCPALAQLMTLNLCNDQAINDEGMMLFWSFHKPCLVKGMRKYCSEICYRWYKVYACWFIFCYDVRF